MNANLFHKAGGPLENQNSAQPVMKPAGKHTGVKPNLYHEPPHTVDLNRWESSFQHLADTRAEFQAELNRQILRPVFSPQTPAVPHNLGLDRMILMLSAQDKLSILHRLVDFYTTKYSIPAERQLTAIQGCSAALAGVDHLVESFIRKPSQIDPAELDAAAELLNAALINLRRSA